MKRSIDVTLALIALAVLSPVICAVALIVRIVQGSPVIYKQSRPGLNELPFTIYKIRTMTDSLSRVGEVLSDGERLTGLGRFLRATSLDEVPELLNVLRGEMSLVGPRPLLLEYLPFFTEEERIRFSVLPGITGLAQIHGRNSAIWDQRLADDIWYVNNRSIWLDLKILGTTLSHAARQKGVVTDPHSRMANLDEERAGR